MLSTTRFRSNVCLIFMSVSLGPGDFGEANQIEDVKAQIPDPRSLHVLGGIMKRSRVLLTLQVLVFLFSFVLTSVQWAQVIAGSPEDKAYQAIARETDSKTRLELLDAFVKNFPNTPDMAQIYEYYSLSYRDLGDSDKEIEYAQKSLALRKDPELMVMLGRVLAIKGDDLPQAIQTIKEAVALAEKIRNNPPPGMPLKDWQDAQDNVVAMAKQLLPYAMDRYKQIFFTNLAAEKDPQKIIAMMDTFSSHVDDPSTRPTLYNEYLHAYMELDDQAKALEYGEKLLTLTPGDVGVLVLMTNAYLIKPIDLTNAAAEANKAVAAADALDSQTKPAGMTDEDWAKQKTQWKTLAYSTRGLVELQQDSTLDAAVADFEKALEWSPTDGVVAYRLGIAYWKQKRIDDAITALAKSAAFPSGVQSQAAQLLETYYKAAHNGSTDGLKELIEKSKLPPEKPDGV